MGAVYRNANSCKAFSCAGVRHSSPPPDDEVVPSFYSLFLVLIGIPGRGMTTPSPMCLRLQTILRVGSEDELNEMKRLLKGDKNSRRRGLRADNDVER